MYIRMIAMTRKTRPMKIISNAPRLAILKLHLFICNEYSIHQSFQQPIFAHVLFQIVDLVPVNERNIELFNQ